MCHLWPIHALNNEHVKETEGDPVNNASKELARQMADEIANYEPIIADVAIESWDLLVNSGTE